MNKYIIIYNPEDYYKYEVFEVQAVGYDTTYDKTTYIFHSIDAFSITEDAESYITYLTTAKLRNNKMKENKKEVNKFFEQLSKCQVIYKSSNDTVSKADQRATVVGYREGDTYRIGVAIRSFKDDMDKAKAKITAGRRAIFSPTTILTATTNDENESNKELHSFLRTVKDQYDLLGLEEEFINIVSV